MITSANGHSNGTPAKIDKRQELRQRRLENRLIVEQMRGQRLAVAQKRQERRQALESSVLYDWVTPYMDLLDRLRRGEPELAGPTSAWQRKWGRNYPIFQTEQELNLLRAPARVLIQTNTYAQGALSALTSYVGCGGYTYRATLNKAAVRDEAPQDLADACQEIIDDFIARNGWQVGENDAYSDEFFSTGLEEEFFQRTIVDGESLLCHFPDEQTGLVTVRTVEPEQLTMPPGENPAETMFGIRTPEDDPQCPEGYFITWTGNSSDCEEIAPEYITHFKRNVPRAIKRGLTDFSFDALDAFNLAGRLRINMTDTAAQQAAIVAVTQHDTGTKEDIQAFRDADAEFTETDPLTRTQINVRRTRRSEWQDIPKGQNYVAGPLAGNSPIHIQVLQACLRGAGVKWNAPEWMVSGDASNNNYASALVADSPFVLYALGQQRNYKGAYRRSMWIQLRQWCKVHGGIMAGGRLWSWGEVCKYVGINVGAPNPEARDELKDAQVSAIEIPLGTDSRQRYCQDRGRDFDRIERDNRQYEDEHAGEGPPLELPPEPPGAPRQPAAGTGN